MSRPRLFLSTEGPDAVILLAAVWSAVGTARRGEPGAPTGVARLLEFVEIVAVVCCCRCADACPSLAPATTGSSARRSPSSTPV